MFFILVINCAFIFSVFIVIANAQGESCNTPDYQNGVCVVLPQCPQLVQWYGSQPNNPQVINYLIGSQRNCGTRSVARNPLVCCSNPVSYQLPSQTRPPPVRTPPPTPSQTPFVPTLAPDNSAPWASRPVSLTTEPIRVTSSPTTAAPFTQAPPRSDGYCEDPAGAAGVCMNIRECPHIKAEFVARQKDKAYIDYIRKSNVICKGVSAVICCTDQSRATNSNNNNNNNGATNLAPRLLTLEEGCGFSNVTHTRVVGGVPAKKGAYPWMALIGYTNNFNEIGWKCGGSLITTRHVLTAAHCIKSTLTTVRLGEHDISTDSDGVIQDIKVIKKVAYPKYDKRDGSSDLAILTLEHDAEINSRVRQVCLPLSEKDRTESYDDRNFIVAGWGRLAEGGKSSNILQELQIPVLSNSVCQDRYQKQGKLISDKQFNNAVLCAGVLEGGKDSCQGDSGGPLMGTKVLLDGARFFQAGIVSYGIGCAREDVPGVYTRVQTFMDWIQEQVSQV